VNIISDNHIYPPRLWISIKKGEVTHNDGGKELGAKKKVTAYVNKSYGALYLPTC